MDAKNKTQVVGLKLENQVHKDIIHGENIRKEMKYADRNIMKNFQLNPHNGSTFPRQTITLMYSLYSP